MVEAGHSGTAVPISGEGRELVMPKRLLQALNGQATGRPPFWFMRQAGRYLPEYQKLRRQEPNFRRFCYTPELTLEATLQPLRRYRPDAAILFSDILVLADALGCGVRFVEGEGPVLDRLDDGDDVARLSVGRLTEHLAPVFTAVGLIARAIPNEVALIGFAGAPWTMALYMIEGRGGSDGGRARAWAYRDPEGFGALIDVLVEATIAYLDRQIGCGAEAVQLFDSWAGLLAADQFRRWVIRPTAAIVKRLRARHPGVPVIGFPRGAGVLYAEYAAATGVQAVGIDAGVPVEWAKTALQGHCAVQGNLDNQLLRAGGPGLLGTTDAILNTLAAAPFVFNLGHGVLPDTPLEHVAAVAERIRGFQPDDKRG